jgi:hypothetical protein
LAQGLLVSQRYDRRDRRRAFRRTSGRLTWANETRIQEARYEAELGFPSFGITGYVAQNHNDHKNVTGGSIISWIPTTVRKAGLKYNNGKLDFMANLPGTVGLWNETEDLISYFHPKDKE